ncbi:MAG: hypothetical protein EA401_14370 [Planctomycetota bacterium]|nr:MAG: hypothetical protein EA401_14370 [Planctomycetota bacterium]
MRLAGALLCCLLLALSSYGDESTSEGNGHRFAAGEIRRYLAETVQEVSWRSAGDDLTYTTTLAMELSCYVDHVDGNEVLLVWRVLDLRVRHRGPDGEHFLDSASDTGLDDPLLGDLMIYHLLPLKTRIDRRNGAVLEFRGQEALIERLKQRHPAANPLAANPRAEAAQRAFDPLRMAALFHRYLVVPGTQDRFPLGQGLDVELPLHWDDNAFEFTLPEDTAPPSITLHHDPTPVIVHLSALKGTGSSVLNNGVLERVHGSIDMTLSGSALTQPVDQKHAIQWQLALLTRTPPSDNTDDRDNGDNDTP